MSVLTESNTAEHFRVKSNIPLDAAPLSLPLACAVHRGLHEEAQRPQQAGQIHWCAPQHARARSVTHVHVVRVREQNLLAEQFVNLP